MAVTVFIFKKSHFTSKHFLFFILFISLEISCSFSFYFSFFSFTLALTFISLQIKEFRIMGLSINDSVYGCVFFFLTGLHFFHLLVGLFLLSLLFFTSNFSYYIILTAAYTILFFHAAVINEWWKIRLVEDKEITRNSSILNMDGHSLRN